MRTYTRNRVFADRRGAAAVEFALIAPLFVGFLLALTQVAVVFFAKAELQEATEATARLVLTGQAANSGMTAAQFGTTLCNNMPALFQCSGLMVSLAVQPSVGEITTSPPTLTYDAHGNLTTTLPFNLGTYGDIMVLQVMYQLPVVAGPLFHFSNQSNGKLLLIATTVFRNEPL